MRIGLPSSLLDCLNSPPVRATVDDGDQKLIIVSETGDLRRLLASSGLETGRPVVVLIGGAAKLGADTVGGLEEIVREGVLATAEALGATVIDGGTDSGVMALAGRAHRELGATVPLVGVAPIGRVTAPGLEGATGSTPLEPNHSHVVLAPGDEWGAELPWMLEAARITSAGKPTVAVLVDGGPLALTEATKCLAQGWPLITIAGSGRAADDLAAFGRGASGAALGGAPATAIHVTELSAGPAPLASLLRSLLEVRSAIRPPADQAPRPKIDYPALYIAASEASKRGQRLHKWLSVFELLLVIGGLLVAVGVGLLPKGPDLPPGIPPPPGATPTVPERLAVLAMAGAFLGAFVVKFISHSASYDDDWFTGRAVAETTKSFAWRYMIRVPPYEGADADRHFTLDLAALVRRAGQIRQAVDRLPARPQQISATMRQLRSLSLPERRDFYVTRRLLDQADWYGRRGAGHRRLASRWFWVSVFFQLAAAGIALLALQSVDSTLLRLMSLFASAAIAITAWTQLNRDDELAKTYASALQELLLVAETAERAETEEELAAVVSEGEEAIGRENKVWVAKRSERHESPEFGHAD
jgi:hypothetical protein